MGSQSVAATVGPEPDFVPDSEANADSDGDPEPELDPFRASGLSCGCRLEINQHLIGGKHDVSHFDET